jgi:DNA-directed RNA polymerase subunit RPC12/RpoP
VAKRRSSSKNITGTWEQDGHVFTCIQNGSGNWYRCLYCGYRAFTYVNKDDGKLGFYIEHGTKFNGTTYTCQDMKATVDSHDWVETGGKAAHIDADYGIKCSTCGVMGSVIDGIELANHPSSFIVPFRFFTCAQELMELALE